MLSNSKRFSRKEKSWIMYDWANSVYATNIMAAIFPILIAQTPQRVGRAHAANAIGFQVGFAGLGASILPGLFGLATEPFGLEAIGYGLVINAVVLLALERWVAARYSARAG